MLNVVPIPKELLENACLSVERANQRLPFPVRGIMVDRNRIQATLEILNAEPTHTLPQYCKNDILEKTQDGLDRRIKEYFGTDLRTANIVTDILEKSGIVRNIKLSSQSTGSEIKGTQILEKWTWLPDNNYYLEFPVQKTDRIDYLKNDILFYQRMLSKNPYDTGTLRTLAKAYKNLGRYAESLEIFERVTKTEPNDAWSFVYFGIVLLKMGRNLEAVSHIERGLCLGNKSDIAFYYLGVAHSNLGQTQESERNFIEALKVNPQCKKAQKKLQTLEKSESASHANGQITGSPKSQDFQTYLAELLKRAEDEGESFFVIESGELHRQIGGYPGSNHRMPICCDVMYGMMQQGDQILYAPPKGKGASLKIQYNLPRTGAGTVARSDAISMKRAPQQPMQNIRSMAEPAGRDFNRSAFYCSDLLMVKLNAGDIASAIKYASDLVMFSDGEIRDAAKELVDQLEVRMESGLDEIPVELITKADRIAHKVKLGFGTM